jgi:hypothetical protein
MSVTDDESGMSKMAREVYGDLPDTYDDPELLTDRATLYPLNKQVDIVIMYCMDHIPGEIGSLYSSDKVVNSDEQSKELYPVEYITILEARGTHAVHCT